MAIVGRFIACAVAAWFVASCGSGAAVPLVPETPPPTQTGAAATAAPAATTGRPPTTAAPTTGLPAPIALSVTITQATYGSVSARSAPDATCSASARLPSGATSTAQGLDTHRADASGNINWTYRTVSNTGKGTGTYTVTCSSSGQSRTVTTPFTVQ